MAKLSFMMTSSWPPSIPLLQQQIVSAEFSGAFLRTRLLNVNLLYECTTLHPIVLVPGHNEHCLRHGCGIDVDTWPRGADEFSVSFLHLGGISISLSG